MPSRRTSGSPLGAPKWPSPECRPRFAPGAPGDGNGDGQPDLYAVPADRHLLTFDGVTTPKDLGVLR
ncbi:hypothetical protein ACFV0O_24060 [Kitasatospora sp. NPDC059577]|uniref:hypothetical protein n=1 Tax=Kitasatospora sp. NPDC059577 TaxID=3346873 RepID=UPI0036AA19AE